MPTLDNLATYSCDLQKAAIPRPQNRALFLLTILAGIGFAPLREPFVFNLRNLRM